MSSDQDSLESWQRTIQMRCWPGFDHGPFYYETEALADQCTEAGTPSHAISAILIYNQLLENLLWAIDYWNYYEIALSVYPKRIRYSTPERLMFGQLIDRINDSQEFLHNEKIIDCCKRINRECRIPAAHKLLHEGVLEDLPNLALRSQTICRELHAIIGEVQYDFWRRFEHLAKLTGLPDDRL